MPDPPYEEFQGVLIKRWLLERRTAYQRVKLAESVHFGKILVLDDQIQSSERDEYIYHETLVHPVMLSDTPARRVLLLGGGEGASLRETLRHRSVESVTMVDIDSEIIEICREHLPGMGDGAFDDPRAEVVIADAREYLESRHAPYDVVIQDLTDPLPDGSCDALFTAEFFDRVRRQMHEGSRFAIQCGSVAIQDLDMFSLVVRTLREVFDYVIPYQAAVPSFAGSWGFAIAATHPIDLPERGRFEASVTERIDGTLGLLDAETFTSLFLLPRYVREALRGEGAVLREQEGQAVRVDA